MEEVKRNLQQVIEESRAKYGDSTDSLRESIKIFVLETIIPFVSRTESVGECQRLRELQESLTR